MPFNADFAAAKVSLVIIISNSASGNCSSCSRSGSGSGSFVDSTSCCGSSGKILTWAGKYKLGQLPEPGLVNAKFRSGSVNTNWEPGMVNKNLDQGR